MTTTIRIKRNTKRRLEDMGKKNETFDDILNKLLDFYDSNKWIIVGKGIIFFWKVYILVMCNIIIAIHITISSNIFLIP